MADDNTPELTPQELAELRQAKGLLEQVYGSKETKVEFERMVKKLNPKAVTSEDELAPHLQPLQEQVKNLTDKLAGINESALAWQKQEKLATLKTAGYTQEGIEKIEQIMKDKGIADPHDAAAIFDKLNPPAQNIASGFQASHMDTLENMAGDAEKIKNLWADPTKAFWDEASKIDAEFKKNVN